MKSIKKQIKSETCILLNYKVILNNQEMEQAQYFTENYVYNETNNKKLIYLPEKNTQYLVDTENKQLREVDLSTQMAQINQIKAMIGEVEMKESKEGGIRNIIIQNDPNRPVRLSVHSKTTYVEKLENTIFREFYEFQQNMQMFSIKLSNNETVKTTESIFSMNGQEQKSIIELIDVENKKEIIETIDEYSNYKIAR